MCLGIPMRVLTVDGLSSRCEAKGVTRTVSLFLLQDELPRPGDHVIVHVGYALQIISPERAHEAWSLWAEADEAAGGAAQ